MDAFALFIFGSLAILVVIFLLIGRYYPGSGADQLDWKPTRSYEDEVRLELEDVDQMIEAQNERRRRDGRAEISEDEIRDQVARAEQQRKQDSESYQDAEESERLDQEDLEQMVEAQNERRRASGRPEITAEQLRADLEQGEQVRREGGDPGRRA